MQELKENCYHGDLRLKSMNKQETNLREKSTKLQEEVIEEMNKGENGKPRSAK